MPKQPLTQAQASLIQQLSQDDATPRFCVEIVEAAMRYRNAMSPSGVMNRDEAAGDLFGLIDKVS